MNNPKFFSFFNLPTSYAWKVRSKQSSKSYYYWLMNSLDLERLDLWKTTFV